MVSRLGFKELPVFNYVELPEGIIIERLMGPLFGVRYPSRKTPSLYVMLAAEIGIHCCQPKCKATFGYEELTAHLEGHAPRKDRRLFR